MKIISFLVLLSIYFCASAQQVDMHFKQIGVLDGLSQTSVPCILQDTRGFIWIGTYDGLNKYDGYGFKIYRHQPGNPQSLPSSRIINLKEDPDGSIWVSTTQGVSHYDPRTDLFQNYLSDNSNPEAVPESGEYWGFVRDKSDKVWIGSLAGLFVLDQKTGKAEKIQLFLGDRLLTGLKTRVGFLEFGDKFLCTSDTILFTLDPLTRKVKPIDAPAIAGSFFQTKSGSLFFVGPQYVYSVDSENLTFRSLKIKNTEYLKKDLNYIYSTGMKEDIFGRVWLGGIPFILSDSTAQVVKHSQDKFWPYNPWGFCADRTGNIWMGDEARALHTDNFYNSKFQTYTVSNPIDPDDPYNSVWTICSESDSVIWIGCQNSVFRLNLENGNMEVFSALSDKKTGYTGKGSLSCIKTRDGKIWIGSPGRLMEFDPATHQFKTFKHDPKDSTSLPPANMTAIRETRDGILWMGCWNQGLVEFDRTTGKSKLHRFNEEIENAPHGSVIWNICETSDGAIWFGTRTGMDRYDRSTNTFQHFFNTGKTKYNVSNIYESPDHFLWFATNSAGFFKFDYKTFQVVKQYTTADGLSNDCIYRMEPDKNGNLWLSTNYGISKFNFEKESFENYTLNDGLLSNEFNGGASAQMPDGKIIFGSADGITLFHPEKMDQNPFPPQILIQSLSMHNKPVGISAKTPFTNLATEGPVTIEKQGSDYFLPFDISYVKEIHLNYDENFLTFEFVALHFARPEKNHYAYKLEGLEKEWNYVGTRRHATYTDLKPDTYIFQVKAANSDGVWSEPIELKILISPPFWQTWWFRTFIVILLLLTIYLIHRQRTRALLKRKKELEETVILRTAEVVQQKEIIEEKHKEINDSINYAERIQRSFLATKTLLDANLTEYFIYFNPKEAVSGDFYWAKNLPDGKFCLVAADSTGHGVPGAIMSILNITSLEKVTGQGYVKPDEILTKTRLEIIERLKNDGSEEGGKDGMDAALLTFNETKSKLAFALANNPLWLIRKGELIEYKGDKMPVGKHDKQAIPFQCRETELKKGDLIYIFTDGFADQFGGENNTERKGGKKFKYAAMKKLLLAQADKSMEQQKILIHEAFENWKGNLEQIDDVCIVGIRI